MVYTQSKDKSALVGPPAKAMQGIARSLRRRRLFRHVWLYLIAIPVLVLMVLPYFYLFVQSLTPWDEVNSVFVPSSLTWRSYEWIWTGGGYGLPQPWIQALLNSLLVTIVDSISMVVLGAIVGYALSILSFRGRRTINTFLLFQMFYPGIILLVPTFLIIRISGLYNTYWAMILPRLVSLWAIFLYTSFFRSVSPEVIEAARLDGASEVRIIFQIMLPIARSITTVIFLFVFMERWTELMWDLIVVKDPQTQTLNVLLSTLFGPYGSFPGPLYAAGTILTLPILLLFLAFSRNFVKGVQLVLR